MKFLSFGIVSPLKILEKINHMYVFLFSRRDTKFNRQEQGQHSNTAGEASASQYYPFMQLTICNSIITILHKWFYRKFDCNNNYLATVILDINETTNPGVLLIRRGTLPEELPNIFSIALESRLLITNE
ncbi:hypothetical protein BB561_003270 [Smittium simulii]|uniref:Uncharacterized protein n=1 Tax=Smittium simulii TaxID=133385 RepID=A0A2T9YM91_9FUNG|nr:hypothetical protein BB561_003270 [Smittium simulii]